ncbi:MAG: NAD(P)-dependent oxidoreductase [Alphaproteobacteria bacterium]
MAAIGFVGLGAMGKPMAGRLAQAGLPLIVHDKAGTAERAPAGARAAASLAEVVAEAETLFLSLPDGKVVEAVAREIAAAKPRKTSLVVDLSTIGLEAAGKTAAIFSGAGIAYLDAPVSGGVAGASKGTLAVMAAGSKADFARVETPLKAMAKNLFHVGEKPGQGQAMKLLNNFLSATAMAATSEAVIFGESQGLDMGTILSVLNVSTGQNTASSDKFVNRILTGTFNAGFTVRLMAKDVGLYRNAVAGAGTSAKVGEPVSTVWRELDEKMGAEDFTRVYTHLGGKRR